MWEVWERVVAPMGEGEAAGAGRGGGGGDAPAAEACGAGAGPGGRWDGRPVRGSDAGDEAETGRAVERGLKAVKRWLRPLVEAYGVEVIESRDLGSYRKVAWDWGLEERAGVFHRLRWALRELRGLGEAVGPAGAGMRPGGRRRRSATEEAAKSQESFRETWGLGTMDAPCLLRRPSNGLPERPNSRMALGLKNRPSRRVGKAESMRVFTNRTTLIR
ncbi:hypothetical protein HRbin11_02337 [bacterium HR11]|nr:hypothetical protein HRbin11_02337 [bacterium HR11]